MSVPSYPMYLANAPQTPNLDLAVHDKYSGAAVAQVPLADAALLGQAIDAAVGARAAMARLPAHRRRAVLLHCVRRFTEDAEQLAQTLCIEAGKPLQDARGEVARLIDTFAIAAEEATRIGGRTLPMDISPRGEGYMATTARLPLGVCAFISPFNFPLNLAAHKVAPAIACGCPFVLKPASLTPLGALQIGAVLAETDLPPGAFSILPLARDGSEQLVVDPRIALLSFTGSPAVGWALKQKAGRKRVVLELGGNAACIVDADADVDDAVNRLIHGAFYQSGQSCIKAQRLLVHRRIYAAFAAAFVARARALRCGNPREEGVQVGPLISTKQAARVRAWVAEARAAGASLLCGGHEGDDAMVPPTVLDNVPTSAKVWTEEIFGPVAVLRPFDTFDEALQMVNDSRFGLQAGLFTRDHFKIQRAFATLQVGGVVVGDAPSFRMDHMPYGGVKDSGVGREGVAYAMEDMLETRLLVVRTPPGEPF